MLFICLSQGCQSIGLHCVELLVDLSRDESTWRGTYNDDQKAAAGARLQTNQILAALSCWESIVLFFAKALLHSVLGLAMMPEVIESSLDAGCNSQEGGCSHYTIDITMSYSRLFVYAALTALLASFTTFMAFRKRKGYLPATTGHLPTIANLVDDWQTDDKGRLWWGDKFPSESEMDSADMASCSYTVRQSLSRHAGTSPAKSLVGPIRAGYLYAG